MTRVFTAMRQEVNNLESSEVVHEPEKLNQEIYILDIFSSLV